MMSFTELKRALDLCFQAEIQYDFESSIQSDMHLYSYEESIGNEGVVAVMAKKSEECRNRGNALMDNLEDLVSKASLDCSADELYNELEPHTCLQGFSVGAFLCKIVSDPSMKNAQVNSLSEIKKLIEKAKEIRDDMLESLALRVRLGILPDDIYWEPIHIPEYELIPIRKAFI
jgi:nucleotidyltransferase/DNA polymerase involved in DNA repair